MLLPQSPVLTSSRLDICIGLTGDSDMLLFGVLQGKVWDADFEFAFSRRS